MFILINSRLRISRQSKRKGCETPEALSSITMGERSAAMKITKMKNLSTLGGKQSAIKYNKITHALLLRRT